MRGHPPTFAREWGEDVGTEDGVASIVKVRDATLLSPAGSVSCTLKAWAPLARAV
jgi:hypothetical protein